MKKNNQQQGFTLIEMIVSVAIFSIVSTITVGALLILIGTNQQLQREQSVMTNLSFALDSMTREIRTGTYYFCASRPNLSGGSSEAIFSDPTDSTPPNNHESVGFSMNDCRNGKGGGQNYHGISFREAGDSITEGLGTRILYYYDSGDYPGGDGVGKIMRRVGDEVPQSVVSSGLDIIDMDIFVTGAENSGSDKDDDQPLVTIFIEAKDITAEDDNTYQLQTTVVQRALDI